MFRSVNKVVALTAREGLDDVAEVTVHHNQSSVNRRNRISGQRLWPWKSPLPRPQFPLCKMTQLAVVIGSEPCYEVMHPLVRSWCTQTSSPEKCTGM